MTKKPVSKTATTLRVVPPDRDVSTVQPPANLAGAGLELWHAVIQQYDFGDIGSYQTLAQCCHAVERAERCRRAIDEDGECIRSKTGVRDHPLLKHELASRAFAVRTLARLGLDLEPVRSGPGRPPSVA